MNKRQVMGKLIGRQTELQALKRSIESDKAEFIAVYGRRRIGKTYLIKNALRDRFDFYTTGIYNGTKSEQLRFFNKQLCECSGMAYPMVSNWFDAFDQLKQYLSGLKRDRMIVFIDELPWMDTPRSGFLKAFEVFWNGWGSDCSRLKLIICGSATTWVMSKLFGARGGLYNRVTARIKLLPFSLRECREFLRYKGVAWSNYQIAEAYMIFGGIPFYLEMIRSGQSLSQAVDELVFSENGALRGEFPFLFRSLFNEAAIYHSVVEALGKKSKGLTRRELQDIVKIPDGGRLTEVLDNLCDCDFVRRYMAYGKKERDVMYQLTDLFTLFNLRYVKQGAASVDSNFWSLQADTPRHSAWRGYAFEQVCLHHISQIKKALGINGVQSDICSWQCAATEEHHGAQIDLLIDRKDGIINLCEIKYAPEQYEITKQYAAALSSRRELFRDVAKKTDALHNTMITTFGVKKNMYSDVVNSEVTLDDLFE